MFYELRSYDIRPEGLEDYLRWANDKVIPLLTGHFGWKVIGFWQAVAKPESGEERPETNVHWMIAWESERQMIDEWAKVRASQEWQTIFKEVIDPQTGERIYHRVIKSALLQPVPNSPLQ
jgi:hypothetical protein